MTRDVAAIVAAAGSGERLGAGIPKAMVELAGLPLVTHSVRALVRTGRVGLVVVAAPPGLTAQFADSARQGAQGVPVEVVEGGDTRAQSVGRALSRVPEDFPSILVHDAARALVPVATVAAVIAALDGGASAVVPGVPVTDTIRQVDDSGRSRTLDRARLRAVQTPQGFSAGALRQAHDAAGASAATATDDAGMVEAVGGHVVIVAGHVEAFKITTPFDLAVAAAVLAGRDLEELP